MYRKLLISLSVLTLISCGVRREQSTVVYTQSQPTVTSQPSVVYTAPTTYTNTAVVRRPPTTGRKVRVTALSTDISQNLDLNAVAALFAQSANLEVFEQALNREDGICNLDLNGDGYVDYLRVVEAEENGVHLVVLQAVLAQDIYQDVATIVAEKPAAQTTTVNYVQIIGDPYIYGRNYIIEPVFVRRPLIFDIFWPTHYVAVYKPYRSPYIWGHMPAYYRPLPPRPMTTYVNQINVFVNNNNYCTHSNYVNEVRYSNYGRMHQTVSRNDYGNQNPDKSFEKRTAAQGITADNARAINESNRVIINRTMSNTDNVKFTGGRQAITNSSATSGTRQTVNPSRATTTSSANNPTSGTRTSSTSSTSSGTRTSSATSGTRTSSATSGTRTSSATSGTRTSSATSGTRTSSATSGTRTSSATSGTRTSSATSGTRTSSATSGTRTSSATSGTRTSNATSGTRTSSATSGTSSSSATSGTRTSSAPSTTRTSSSSSTTSGTRTSSTSSGRR